MIRKTEYNGWTNHYTWCVDWWLTHNERAHVTAQEIVGAGKPLTHNEFCRVVQRLKEWAEDAMTQQVRRLGPELFPMAFKSDLFRGGMKRVNWSEIVDSLRE
jgi:hypothetical protein